MLDKIVSFLTSIKDLILMALYIKSKNDVLDIEKQINEQNKITIKKKEERLEKEAITKAKILNSRKEPKKVDRDKKQAKIKLFIATFLVLLTSCTRYIVKTEYVPVSAPELTIEKCHINLPVELYNEGQNVCMTQEHSYNLQDNINILKMCIENQNKQVEIYEDWRIGLKGD